MASTSSIKPSVGAGATRAAGAGTAGGRDSDEIDPDRGLAHAVGGKHVRRSTDETATTTSSDLRDTDYDDNDHDDEDEESGPIGVPFPSQEDPSKPLRPKHYRKRKAQRGVRRWLARNEGLLLIALAQAFYAHMAFFFKLLNGLPGSSSVSAVQVIFLRMSFTWICCVVHLHATGDPHPWLGPPAVRKLLALRGFVGFSGLFGLYYSLQFLSLADATVITFLSPMGTGLLGWLFLNEPFTRGEATAGLFSFVGVMCIARPSALFGTTPTDLDLPVEPEAVKLATATALTALSTTGSAVSTAISTSTSAISAGPAATILASIGTRAGELLAATNGTIPHDGGQEPPNVTEAQRIVAVGVALLGCVGSAAAYTTIRCIGTRASPLHSVSYFALWSTIVSGSAMVFTGQQFVIPTEARWNVLLLLIGIFGFLAQFLAAMGLQREKAGRAASAVYLQIFFATLLQVTVLHVPLEPLSILGSCIILSAAAYVSIRA